MIIQANPAVTKDQLEGLTSRKLAEGVAEVVANTDGYAELGVV
jgi:hypothetical protein